MRVTASPVESETLQPEVGAGNDSENLCFPASGLLDYVTTGNASPQILVSITLPTV
jgi:hypothetical protein